MLFNLRYVLLILFLVGVLGLVFSFVTTIIINKTPNQEIKEEEKEKEGFYSYSVNNTPPNYSQSKSNSNDDLLLQDTDFPIQPDNKIQKVSKKNYKDFWYLFPHTKNSNFGGSYDQITNNFKYQRNPDIGNAIPGEVNSVFYQDNVNRRGNTVCPLPPIQNEDGKVRVGFFNTDVDLLY